MMHEKLGTFCGIIYLEKWEGTLGSVQAELPTVAENASRITGLKAEFIHGEPSRWIL